MHARPTSDSGSTIDRVLQSLADGQRRTVLGLLTARSVPVSLEDLATAVADDPASSIGDDGSGDDAATVAARLTHVHLPALDDAGLLEWDREADRVTTGDAPGLECPAFRRLLGVDADDWDDVLLALADRRRRIVLSELASADVPIRPAVLARRVVEREADVLPSTIDLATIDDVAASLHHSTLPALESAGLIEAGPTGLAYLGHPAFDREWLPGTVAAGDRPDGPGERGVGGIVDGAWRPVDASPAALGESDG
jgi:DNA-binding transcriptional ArsR family regulator